MRLRISRLICLLAVGWVALLSDVSVSVAAEIEGVEFAQSAPDGDGELRLRGVALLRYRIVFKAYVAALYLPPRVPSDAVLSDVPKRLEIEYFWSLDAADIARAGREILQRNVTSDEFVRLERDLSQIDAAYRDVKPGDRYALTYLPGLGTRLSLNGESLVLVPGPDFARAYFSIWLGTDPLDQGLKRALLGDT
ncbi:chalcone isomerase family protein [Myxococcota bacterium]|nr:chalcone isomerase family protein [Myxococcota bacterium]